MKEFRESFSSSSNVRKVNGNMGMNRNMRISHILALKLEFFLFVSKNRVAHLPGMIVNPD